MAKCRLSTLEGGECECKCSPDSRLLSQCEVCPTPSKMVLPAPPPRKRLSEAIADAIRGYTLQSSIVEAIQAVLAREGVDGKECKT